MEITNKVKNSFLCLCASAAIGAGGMYLYNKEKIKGEAQSDSYNLINECTDTLRDLGFDEPGESEARVSVINGYLSAYGDKYMKYFEKSDDIEGYMQWINDLSCLVTCGYEVGADDAGRLVVTKVEPGSVAEKFDLCVGDIILQVDGKTAENDGVKALAYELPGPDGSNMHLVLIRDGKQIEQDFLRSNDLDRTRTNVTCELKGKTVVLKFDDFSTNTSNHVSDALDLVAGKYDSIIFDLRENGGGYSEEAVYLADRFVGGASVRFFDKNGDVSELNTYDNENDESIPIVVLVGRDSASAAEILTSLLMQYGQNAKSLGTRTYGKGVYQKDIVIKNYGTLRYTAGYYTVGDWECYDGKGIKPDIVVEMDSALIGTKDDVQLKKALELLA